MTKRVNKGSKDNGVKAVIEEPIEVVESIETETIEEPIEVVEIDKKDIVFDENGFVQVEATSKNKNCKEGTKMRVYKTNIERLLQSELVKLV